MYVYCVVVFVFFYSIYSQSSNLHKILVRNLFKRILSNHICLLIQIDRWVTRKKPLRGCLVHFVGIRTHRTFRLLTVVGVECAREAIFFFFVLCQKVKLEIKMFCLLMPCGNVYITTKNRFV